MAPHAGLAFAVAAVALAAVRAASTAAASVTTKPHVVFLLIDDFGFADASWHRPAGYEEVQTPQMAALVESGIELDQHYTYKFCSPSRCALQTGRHPIHVNVQNLSPGMRNPADPDSGYVGVPRNMTGIATKMRQGGYRTYAYGKWDVGMATPDHTPSGRGYDEAVIYFEHQNEYWTSRWGKCENKSGAVSPHDLWCDNATAGGPCGEAGGHPAPFINADSCQPAALDDPFPANETGCVYEDDIFAGLAVSAIENHARSTPNDPMFMFFSSHAIHSPYQVPQSYYNMAPFASIDQHNRRTYHAMVKHVDDTVGRLVAALKSTGMYDNTLIVMSSDNGGPMYYLASGSEHGYGGANNWPLKGGKASNWQGGIRVNAFVSGGAVPASQRGTKAAGLAALWDWYTTFAHLAGVDSTDTRAAAAGLPPVDGVNLWPYLSGAASTSPRTTLPIGSSPGANNLWGVHPGTIVDGFISQEGGKLWKLLLGNPPMAGWTGPQYPNVSSTWVPQDVRGDCGSTGCLYELTSDPTEHNDLAATMPGKVAELMKQLQAANATTFAPFRGKEDPTACEAALARPDVFWGPWVEE